MKRNFFLCTEHFFADLFAINSFFHTMQWNCFRRANITSRTDFHTSNVFVNWSISVIRLNWIVHKMLLTFLHANLLQRRSQLHIIPSPGNIERCFIAYYLFVAYFVSYFIDVSNSKQNVFQLRIDALCVTGIKDSSSHLNVNFVY